MAGGGGADDINPYVAFVDLFSSVILVLLLFMLIMFVNVGYYMQFTSKGNKDSAIETDGELNKTAVELMKQQIIAEAQKQIKAEPKAEPTPAAPTPPQPKVVQQSKPKETTESNDSKAVSNTNTISREEKTTASTDFKENELIIAFKDNEIFLTEEVLSKVINAIETAIRGKPNAIATLSVGDSVKIISTTQAKQVSLGRLLSIKNSLNKAEHLKNRVKISYKQEQGRNYEFGFVKIDVK
jgi:hypothetical protein